MLSLIISTLITSAIVYLNVQNFTLMYFFIGLGVMIISFLHFYHIHVKEHFSHISRFAHLREWKHILSHGKQSVLAFLLFISTNIILFTLEEPTLEKIIWIIFTISIFLYYLSIAHGLKRLFEYEEKHIHLMSIIKFISVIFTVIWIVLLTNSSFITLEIGTFSIFILFLWILYQFSFQMGLPTKKFEGLFLILTAIISAIIFNTVIINQLSNIFSISILFAFYYFAWGIFRHFLMRDLRFRIFLEYLIFALLIVAIVNGQTLIGSGRIL